MCWVIKCSSFGSVNAHIRKGFSFSFVCVRGWSHLSALCSGSKSADSSRITSRREWQAVASAFDDIHQFTFDFEFSCLLFRNFDVFSIRNQSSDVEGLQNSAIGFWKSPCGFGLSFAEYLLPCLLPDNKSAFRYSEFVTEAIAELLASGCIVLNTVLLHSVLTHKRKGKSYAW